MFVNRNILFISFVFQMVTVIQHQFILKEMAPRKGMSPITRVISLDLNPHLPWYILNSKICGMTPTQYFKRSPIVSSLPEDFQRIGIGNIRLQDGRHYSSKRSSNGTEILCSSFGLISLLLRQKTSSECHEYSLQLREFLNQLDLSGICGYEQSEMPAENISRASRRLEMPQTPPNKAATSSSVVMTAPKQWKVKARS